MPVSRLWVFDEDEETVPFTLEVDPFILSVASALGLSFEDQVSSLGRGAYDLRLGLGAGEYLYFRNLGGWDDGGWQCGLDTLGGTKSANSSGDGGTPRKAYELLIAQCRQELAADRARVSRLDAGLGVVELHEGLGS
jgi:hypothetical protein